jgi:hypothetical protein
VANAEHLAQLQEGVEAWNRWRDSHPGIQPDLRDIRLDEMFGEIHLAEANLTKVDFARTFLRKADLQLADLRGADLRGAFMDEANLAEADLRDAVLRETHFPRARLARAFLTRAILWGANLRGADLHEADLREVDLHRANLAGADLSRALMGGTSLGDVDFRQVQGLHTIRHLGPSTVGINTLYRSQGQIPDAFLRGAGVPEEFITYIKSLVGDPLSTIPALLAMLVAMMH